MRCSSNASSGNSEPDNNSCNFWALPDADDDDAMVMVTLLLMNLLIEAMIYLGWRFRNFVGHKIARGLWGDRQERLYVRESFHMRMAATLLVLLLDTGIQTWKPPPIYERSFSH